MPVRSLLLEPFRGELEEACTQQLGFGAAHADRGANQRKALFSLSKKLASGL